MKRPRFLKGKRRRTAEKIARVRAEAKARARKVRGNGHVPKKDT